MPLRTIERTASVHDDLEAILALLREYGPSTVVVGDPLTLSGQRGLAAQKMDAFTALLAKAYGGPIERIDERLTTAQVTRSLLADVSRKKRKGVVDQLAAALILDAYLARRRRSGP